MGSAATIRWYDASEYTVSDVCSDWTHRGVSDLAIGHGDIEVDADEDALALEVEVGDGELLGERHVCRECEEGEEEEGEEESLSQSPTDFRHT